MTREQIRARYTRVAKLILDAIVDDAHVRTGCNPTATGSSPGCLPFLEDGPSFGTSRYPEVDLGAVPLAARAASLGCGCPVRSALLHAGERVLDVGAGGGIDAILAAHQVKSAGIVVGLDMTREMTDLGRGNVARAGLDNVFFVQGAAEDIPLRTGSMDVVVSNCSINLIVEKDRAIAEIHRVLADHGRFVASDIVADDRMSIAERLARAPETGCTVGALSRTEYIRLLTKTGFVQTSVRFTHRAAAGMHGALIRGVKRGLRT